MKVEVLLRDGTAIDVPLEGLRLGADGWTRFLPLDVAAGRTVVAARLTYDLQPERFDADGTFTLSVRGVDFR